MSNEFRYVEILSSNGFERGIFEDVKTGDIFKLFQPDGTPISQKEKFVLVARQVGKKGRRHALHNL